MEKIIYPRKPLKERKEMKVWLCKPNNAVLPPWMTANCIRNGELCPHLVATEENELPSGTRNFGEDLND